MYDAKCHDTLSHKLFTLLVTVIWLEMIKPWYKDIKYAQYVILIITTFLIYNMYEICTFDIGFRPT